MASLDPIKKLAWKNALARTKAPWVICGIKSRTPAPLDGMAGLVDWMVHGQVSQRLLLGHLASGEVCIVPGDPQKQRPSFLLYPVDGSAGASLLAEKARKLQISELALAESTFPEDFLAKVKQTLKKEGIRYQKLEPETDESS